MRSLRILIAAALLAAIPAASHAAEPEAVVAAKHELQAAVSGGDYAPVVAARGRFAAMSAAEPGSALLHYWVAAADWRAATAQMRPGLRDKKKIKQHCKAGLAEIDKAIALDPALTAEAIAVKAGLQGLEISVGGAFAGMSIGPRIEADLERAKKLAPDQPRLLFAEAMNTLHKPAFVGGSAEKALAGFRAAIARFATATVADPAAPDWGRDDAQLWAGQACMRLGDPAAAAEHFRAALQINPELAWAREVLLPGAEKAIAGKKEGKAQS